MNPGIRELLANRPLIRKGEGELLSLIISPFPYTNLPITNLE
jgi:hypothetical protein